MLPPAAALTIKSADKERFNAFDASLTYDPTVLQFNSLSDTAYTADTSAEGTVRICSYGEQHYLGTVVSANFTVLQETAGSNVTLTSAKADLSENAVENNAPDATIRNASVSVSTLAAFLLEPCVGVVSRQVRAFLPHTVIVGGGNAQVRADLTMGDTRNGHTPSKLSVFTSALVTARNIPKTRLWRWAITSAPCTAP